MLKKQIVIVDKDLEDLIPTFLSNRQKDIATMRLSLTTGDYEQIRIIGHSMKGFGSGYGFDFVTEVGQLLEAAAKLADTSSIEQHIRALESYLSNITIIFE